jgi:hypothetical protein
LFGSQALETAIGLTVMFFVLATAASAVTESISRIMQKRAKDLEGIIREMFTKRADDKEKRRDRVTAVKANRQQAETFMNLFKDTSIWQGAESAAGHTLLLKKKVGNSYLSARSFAEAVHEVVKTKPVDEVADALKLVPSLEKRLTVLVDEAKRGILDVKAGLESWFDETMSRAEGAYKRWAALVLFVVGLAFAVLGNASSTDVARGLWQDPATRAAVAEAAGNLQADSTDDITSVAEATLKLGEIGLPVGWDVSESDDVMGEDHTKANNGLVSFFQHSKPWEAAITILGWFLTALLVMLGGPFWFDLLTRLVALRSAGKKPPTADEDGTSATALALAAATVKSPTPGSGTRAALTSQARAEYEQELNPLRDLLTKITELREEAERNAAGAAP